MRIVFNAGALRGLGSSQVGQAIITSMGRASRSLRGEAWVPQDWPTLATQAVDVHPVSSGLGRKLLLENLTIRRRLAGCDALFSLGDTSVPFVSVPHLLLVHTPYLAYMDKELDFALSSRFRARIALQQTYFAVGLPTVSRITVQTRHMGERIVRHWGVARDRIDVIPSAVAIPVARASTPAKGYFAYPASASPHKNHTIVADVCASLRRRRVDIPIRVTVTPDEVPDLVARARKFGVLDCIEFLGTIDHAACRTLLAHADAAFIPSKLETFGLTYFEAMSLGTPIVAADREFALEACGDAALYADPDDGDSLAEKLMLARERREALGARALSLAADKRVTWDEVARLYLNVLETMVS